jgi:hypothetical protein
MEKMFSFTGLLDEKFAYSQDTLKAWKNDCYGNKEAIIYRSCKLSHEKSSTRMNCNIKEKRSLEKTHLRYRFCVIVCGFNITCDDA